MIKHGLVILTLATGGVIPAVAASDLGECRVRLYPPQPSPQWISATRALDAQLRQSAPGDRDCLEVVVHAEPERATVAVLTADGRRAERPLRSADELAPTVEGLIVTVTPATAGDDQVEDTAAVDSLPRRPHLLLGAAGGGRLNFPGTSAGAVIDLTAGVTWAQYDLSLFGGWGPNIPVPSTWTSFHATSSSLEAGVSVGRRHGFRFGDAIAGVRLGAIRRAGVWGAEGALGMADDSMPPAPMRVFPLVGAYGAFAFSPSSLVRVRPQVLFQWLPTAAGSGYGNTPTTNGAFVPSWSLTVSIGAESGIL